MPIFKTKKDKNCAEKMKNNCASQKYHNSIRILVGEDTSTKCCNPNLVYGPPMS